jgi:hypothetical protein
MAKLTDDYFVVPPGEIYPVRLSKGEDVTGEIEAMARADGKIAPQTKAHKKAPENKG